MMKNLPSPHVHHLTIMILLQIPILIFSNFPQIPIQQSCFCDICLFRKTLTFFFIILDCFSSQTSFFLNFISKHCLSPHVLQVDASRCIFSCYPFPSFNSCLWLCFQSISFILKNKTYSKLPIPFNDSIRISLYFIYFIYLVGMILMSNVRTSICSSTQPIKLRLARFLGRALHRTYICFYLATS